MNVQLRDYQQRAIDEIVSKAARGTRRLIFQLATGGGKTVTFAALIDLYLKAHPGKKALVLVHREPLLVQARKTLINNHGIVSSPITARDKWPNPMNDVYVAMVDTFYNRLRRRPSLLDNVGLVIIDECHRGEFRKLHAALSEPFIFGFSATPISARKDQPLNKLYDDIICAVDIPDLIKMGALVPNRTLSVKGVNRALLSMSANDFNERKMGEVYSAPKYVKICVDKYREFCDGKKAIVFNCNIDHSRLVQQAFESAGYLCRHIDSTMPDHQVEAAYRWFRETPGALLMNVGKATTGYDEPSIEVVIVNRSTTSLSMWLQMCGRGSRPFPGKDQFLILDLGGNARELGDWATPRPWDVYFRNPPKPGQGNGIPPMKECPACESFIPAGSKVCPICGEVSTADEQYDGEAPELEWINSTISVRAAVEVAQVRSYSPYQALHAIKERMIDIAFQRNQAMDEQRAYQLLAAYQTKVKEWCKLNEKPYNQWHKDRAAEWFMERICERFNFEFEPIKIEL